MPILPVAKRWGGGPSERMVEGQRRRAITRLRQRFALPPPHGFATGRIKGRNRPFATTLSRFPIIEPRLLLFANEARRRCALPRSVIAEQQRRAADPPALPRPPVGLPPHPHPEVGPAAPPPPPAD